MKKMIGILLTAALVGCVNEGNSSLYCDEKLLVSGADSIYRDSGNFSYTKSGQWYYYKPEIGSTCKVVKVK